MIQSITDIPVGEEVIFVEPEPPKANYITTAFWIHRLSQIFNLTAIRGGLVDPLHHLWINYYPRLPFGEERVVMPRSALTFIITVLLAFVEIKSQGMSGFPFLSHPHTIMVSITSLLMYGLASAAELVVSAAGLDPTSVYAIIARSGRIICLCMLVASLTCLFYF